MRNSIDLIIDEAYMRRLTPENMYAVLDADLTRLPPAATVHLERPYNSALFPDVIAHVCYRARERGYAIKPHHSTDEWRVKANLGTANVKGSMQEGYRAA